MARKRHLLIRQIKSVGREAACGQVNPRHYSTNPAEVSCVRCQRSLHMADAEVKKHLGK